MLCKKQRNLPNSEAGQILLIVILVIIVALTIGLSFASRSITSLKSSTEESESQKALAAAEAGIERVIQGDTLLVGSATLNDNLNNKSSYSVSVEEVKDSPFLLNGGNLIPKAEGADLWLSAYSSDPSLKYTSQWYGTLNIAWGDAAAPCNNAALEVIIISGSKNSPVSRKYVYDPCSERRSSNNFSIPLSGQIIIDGKTFFYGASISVAQDSPGLIARIIPIYNNATIGVTRGESDPEFSLQGYRITSFGKSGQANRTIAVFKGWPQTYLPYLSYGLFVAN